MIKLFISGYILLLFTCGTNEQSLNNETNNNNYDKKIENSNAVRIDQHVSLQSSDEREFLAFYHSFTKAIKSKKPEMVNSFFDENNGVFFIESNGAMPSFLKTYKINAFKSLQGKSFFELNFKSLDIQPTIESLPKVICDTTKYDKQGCFAEKSSALAKSDMWSFTNLNEKEQQAIAIYAKSIVYTVVNTCNYTYYFSKTKSGWKVTFIDIRIPCEA